MEVFNTDGVVLKVRHTGESDRIVTVLTRDRGVLSAFAKAARRPKSKLHAGTQTFCFSDLTFRRNGDSLNITEASVREVFYDLNSDLKTLALAQYFSQLAEELIPPGDSPEECLRLLLNSFYFLCDKNRSPLLVKAATELRLAALSGYTPDVGGCCRCGGEAGEMFLDCAEGLFYCRDCGGERMGARLTAPAFDALRVIVTEPLQKIYSVRLPEADLQILSDAAERYLQSQTERAYRTLSFYKSV